LNSLKAKGEDLRIAQEAMGLQAAPIFQVGYEGQGLNGILKITRIGIDPSLLNIPRLYLLYPDQLHYTEQEVLRKALYSLGALLEKGEEIVEPSDQEEEPKKSVVIFDLIKRQNGSVLNRSEEGLYEIHSAILWRYESQIILLDPNKCIFSAHLVDGIRKTFNIEVKTSNMAQQFYFTKNGQTQIQDNKIVDVGTGYCYGEEILVKPRDCIDLAVKIGFEILELQNEGNSFAQITEGLRIVSNNKQIHGLLGPHLDASPIRELQSSQTKLRRETAAWLAKNSKLCFEIASTYPPLAFVLKNASIYGLRSLCITLQPFVEYEKKLRDFKEKQKQNQK